MVMSPAELETKDHYAGEDQQQFTNHPASVRAGIASDRKVVTRSYSQECEGAAAMKSSEGDASQQGQEPLNTEAQESALLRAVVKQRLVKTMRRLSACYSEL
jgi:hypothetical protein